MSATSQKNESRPVYQVGAAKAEITAFFPGVGMMGYGMYHQFVEQVETPLFARAVIIKTGPEGKKVAWVNAEICFVSLAIKAAVLERLGTAKGVTGYCDENVMITAQHTHSGPGGYSHYPLYNLSIPGFMPQVFDGIVQGMVEAIVQADLMARPATIRFASGGFPMNCDVAFNRSLAAYNRNPEVTIKRGEGEANAAVDRRMLLFRFDDSAGNPIASWNFFGVHATSISNDQHRICSDNKGYAASRMEQAMAAVSGREVVSVFAQRKAGDVTPNYVYDIRKRRTRGRHEDDFESARHNGSLQFEKAMELFQSAAGQGEMPVELDCALSWLDFTRASVDPEFCQGERDVKTGLACHGVAFMKGTREGPGISGPAVWILSRLSRALKASELLVARCSGSGAMAKVCEKFRIHGEKDIALEAGEGRVFGVSRLSKVPLPGFLNGALAAFKQFHANGSLSGIPWIPQVLPLQLMIVGEHAFAGIPGEVTTVAGQRIENSLLDILRTRGVTEVVAASYCNGYCGYLTTPEEYEVQAYEGGHTVFGKHTLGAVQTRFRQMAIEMLKPEAERRIHDDGAPRAFTPEELALRSFDIRFRK